MQTGELEIIAGIRRAVRTNGRGKNPAVRLGIGDDCAILRVPKGHELLVTTDLSLEGRHFRRDWHPARAVGHRTLARGLSDLAAMGASPIAAFLSLAMPRELAGSKWANEFLAGLLGLAKASGVTLAGGDTAEFSAGVVADIVLTGSAPKGKALRRSRAKAGDVLYVTGALGGAAAEFSLLSKKPRAFAKAAVRPHLFPEPRIAVGKTLRKIATACIDVSDGLSTDLSHLCAESKCGALVEASAVPVHALAARRKDAMRLALHGGEDYELLFTAKASTKVPKMIAGVAVTKIGMMVKGRSVKLVDDNGKKTTLKAEGWEHFK
jgi:thiamine-monophosphate kinase